MSYVRLGDDITSGIQQGFVQGAVADVTALTNLLLPGVGAAVAGQAGQMVAKQLVAPAVGMILRDVTAPLTTTAPPGSMLATVISGARQRLAPIKRAATVSIVEIQQHQQQLLAAQAAQQQQITTQSAQSAATAKQSLEKYALYAVGGILTILVLSRFLRR